MAKEGTSRINRKPAMAADPKQGPIILRAKPSRSKRKAISQTGSPKNAPKAMPKAACGVKPTVKPVHAAKYGPPAASVRSSATPAADANALWTAYGRNTCDVTRNALMEFYLPVVRFQAERLRARLPDGVDVDDLISAGVFGLEKAIRSFDLSRGFKFETFASQRIHGEILDSLRALDWAPRLVRSRTAKVDVAVRRFEMVNGRKPTEMELAENMGIHDGEEFLRVRRDSAVAAVGSLDRKWSDGDSNRETCDAEVLVDASSDGPLAEASRRDLKAALLRSLTRSEKLIVSLYYWEQMTMKEIGKVLDLSESRVSQMHASILGRLKAQIGTRADELA